MVDSPGGVILSIRHPSSKFVKSDGSQDGGKDQENPRYVGGDERPTDSRAKPVERTAIWGPARGRFTSVANP